MAPTRKILSSLERTPRGMRFDLVGQLGKIRREKRADGWAYWVDLRPFGRIWSHRGIRITDEATALRVLEAIRGKVAEGRPLEVVIAEYAPVDSKPNLVPTWVERWLELMRAKAMDGERSPSYVAKLEQYAKQGSHFGFFDGITVHEITFGVLEDWSLWLGKRGIGGKTRWNVMAAFRAFLSWLKDRELIATLPKFPWPSFDEHVPRVLSIEDQDAVLAAIREQGRGIFLALALMGLRPAEARALDVADYDYRSGWLSVDKAVKGRTLAAPIRGTKTRKGKRLPVPETLAEWVDQHVEPSARLQARPLFVNPATGNRWTHSALLRTWKSATASVGVGNVCLYEGTKHTFATDAVRRGVSERALQTFLGHQDVRSTRRYAQLGEHALVSVLRPRFVGGLSVAENRVANPLKSQRELVELRGIEPLTS